jgi:hypothetical protein
MWVDEVDAISFVILVILGSDAVADQRLVCCWKLGLRVRNHVIFHLLPEYVSYYFLVSKIWKMLRFISRSTTSSILCVFVTQVPESLFMTFGRKYCTAFKRTKTLLVFGISIVRWLTVLRRFIAFSLPTSLIPSYYFGLSPICKCVYHCFLFLLVFLRYSISLFIVSTEPSLFKHCFPLNRDSPLRRRVERKHLNKERKEKHSEI